MKKIHKPMAQVAHDARGRYVSGWKNVFRTGKKMRNPTKQRPIKIESEIPIPNEISWAAAARAMEVGDSVEVENRKQANALGVALYQSGFRAISRVTVFPKVRVWKALREKRPWLSHRR
jgi:hypothetical protein